MSHYVIGVLLEDGGKTLEEMLAPFKEGAEPEGQHSIFVDITDKRRNTYESGTVTKAKDREGNLLSIWDDVFRVAANGRAITHRVPDDGNYEVIEVPFKGLYPTFDEFMTNFLKADRCEKTGRYGYWHTYQARWDGYEVGGRWKDKLLTMDGVRCDSAKLKDIDWEGIASASLERLKDNWDKNHKKIGYPFSGIKSGETKESYLAGAYNFNLYAILTPDGVWNSVEDVGWWNDASEAGEEKAQWKEKFKERFIDSADPDLTLVIIDLHI